MFNSENPQPVENDPIADLLDFNIEDMSEEEIGKHVDKLHLAANNPKELNRLISGKSRAKKKTKSTRTAAENAALDNILEGF